MVPETQEEAWEESLGLLLEGQGWGLTLQALILKVCQFPADILRLPAMLVTELGGGGPQLVSALAW